jgi:hypothetical protein
MAQQELLELRVTLVHKVLRVLEVLKVLKGKKVRGVY